MISTNYRQSVFKGISAHSILLNSEAGTRSSPLKPIVLLDFRPRRGAFPSNTRGLHARTYFTRRWKTWRVTVLSSSHRTYVASGRSEPVVKKYSSRIPVTAREFKSNRAARFFNPTPHTHLPTKFRFSKVTRVLQRQKCSLNGFV